MYTETGFASLVERTSEKTTSATTKYNKRLNNVRINTKDEDDVMVECGGCGRIERVDKPTRNWLEVTGYTFGPLGGGPVYELRDEMTGEERTVDLAACSEACWRKIHDELLDYVSMRKRS
jgi:hypothetical protein